MNHVWMVEYLKDGEWVVDETSPCKDGDDAYGWARICSEAGEKVRVRKYIQVSS